MKGFIVIWCCLLFSCKSENELKFQLRLENYVDENFESYEEIYDQINLWIEESNKLRRENLISLIYYPSYQVDRLLLINEEETKLVGTINMSHSNVKNCISDYIYMFWGIKISNKWYFIKGGNLFVPRSYYKYNINEPLKYYQLSYIGRDYFLKHFVKNDQGKLIVDSELLNNHVSLERSSTYKDKDPIVNWLAYIKDINSRIVDQNEIEDNLEDNKNEEHKDTELPEKGSKAWKELYGTKTPLFEREEWKNYEAQLKNQSHRSII